MYGYSLGAISKQMPLSLERKRPRDHSYYYSNEESGMDATRLVELLRSNGVCKGKPSARNVLAGKLLKDFPNEAWDQALFELYEDFDRTGARAPGYLLEQHLIAGTWVEYLKDVRAEAKQRARLTSSKDSGQPSHVLSLDETQEYLARQRAAAAKVTMEREASRSDG